MLCNSWVVVSIDTGKPVLETWSPEIAAKIDTSRYIVVTALEWLQHFNRQVKDGLVIHAIGFVGV